MAFLIIKKATSEEAGKTFAIEKPVTVVGRTTLQNKPDIELNDEVVSRRHLEIVCNAGKCTLKDLGSTNGTMLNDDRIIPGEIYDLKHNCTIGLGVDGDSARIIFQYKESEATNVIVNDGKVQSTSSSPVSWLVIDKKKREVIIDGKRKSLSRKEYDLLSYLYLNAGSVCSRDDIIRSVWSDSKDPTAISEATMDQLIHRLREKVEPDPSKPVRIISKKAFGYMLE